MGSLAIEMMEAKMAEAKMAPDDDAAALAAAKRGDPAAQRRLFVRHKKRVAAQIQRMTGDASAVDDLVQEVFISAFSALGRFRGDSKLETWLYRITCNKVHNWWDATQRRVTRISRAHPHGGDEIDPPDRVLEAKEQRERLYEAVARLPPKLREAFAARALEGMNLQDASAMLGVPISTVSYRTRRAESLLCEMLDIDQERQR